MSFASLLRSLQSPLECKEQRRTCLAHSSRRKSVQLSLESLEDRTLLSAGSLDLSFGTSGMVSTDFTGSGNDSARVVAVQSDGKVVVVGEGNQRFLEL